MITELLIDDKVVEVPELMPIKIYQILMAAPELYKDNSPMLISLFTGIPVPEIKNMTMDQINLIEAFLHSRVKIPNENELVLTFVHDGIEYGLENDWGKMAFGAWIDIEVYSNPENIYANLHKLMSIIYRPIISKNKKNPKDYKIEKYKSELIEERAELMREVPISIWLGAAQFFFSIATISTENMHRSLVLKNKIETMAMKGMKILPKVLQRKIRLDTTSTLPTTTLQIKTSQNSMK